MSKLFKRVLKFFDNEYILISIILVLGIGVRLYKINNPIADWHSWRQADTASVTREYVKNGLNMLYPKYHDISSIQTGIYNKEGLRLVEFPIYNAVHLTLVKLVPRLSLEVLGRLLSIVCSMISGLALFFLGKKLYGKWVGMLSFALFSFLPFNIYFSRVILPEPMAIMFGLISLLLFVWFLDKEKKMFLYSSGLSLALGMLIKPFIIFFTIPLFYLIEKKYGIKNALKNPKLLIPFLVFAFISLVPFFLWRIWINQWPLGTPFYKWMFNGSKIRFKPSYFRWIFTERLGSLILGGWGLILFVAGIVKQKKNQFVNFFLLGMLLYVVIFASVNVMHDYYQLMAIPGICMAVSLGIFSLWGKKQNQYLIKGLTIFSVIIMLLTSAVQIKEFYRINHPEIIMAGEAIDKIAGEDDLIIAPYNGDTAFLYQTKRKGWPVVDVGLDKVIERGAKYFVGVNFADPDIKTLKERGYKVLEERGEYIIIDLTTKVN